MQEQRIAPVQAAWSELECFGCGPANDAGLGLESYVAADGERLVATHDPDERYTSGAPNVAYGGLVASLIDCHSVWTAITVAHREHGYDLAERRLEYVTGDLSVNYRRPTPLDEQLRIEGWVEGEVGRTVTVHTEVGTDEETTASGEVTAVEVSDHYGE